MTPSGLTVIEASAGTGKTFSLVTRLLTLIFNGTAPERIVALTFSRMAAGEIFNSFIERLSKAAGDDAGARKESENLGIALTKADFASMLRKVISTQHLSLIGTLDSFLMRIVRMLPLELGLQGEIRIMSDYRSPHENARLVADLLKLYGDDAKEVFRHSFMLALGTAGAKKFQGSFSGFIDKWHRTFLDSESFAWGEPKAIWDEVPEWVERLSIASIRGMADGIATLEPSKDAEKMAKAVAAFRKKTVAVPAKLKNEPLALEALEMMQRWHILRALETTRGIFRLMMAYEKAYDLKIRQRGLITFDDMPRLLARLADWSRLSLEYRMDAKFDHWALDEFQDTSRSQWNAIENLVFESVRSGGEKSVFVVGDRKQAIYEWRGGDVGIIGELVQKAREPGNFLGELNLSYRYRPEISKAINALFSSDVVRSVIDMDSAAQNAKWECAEHTSANAERQGYVAVVQAEKAASQASFSDFFAPVEEALKAVRPWDKGISTAILVRKNSHGKDLLAYLKSKGIDRVVFEGDLNIFDSPVLLAMVDLLRLAEHPGDGFAYAHIRHSALGRAMFSDGFPSDPAELSATLLEMFASNGMVRTFRKVREMLKKVEDSWNDFTEARFEDFIKCATEFEAIYDASTRLSDFAKFVEQKTRRDFAQPGVVRIMTMHSSKGLGFDHVIIPFYEHRSLFSEEHTDVVTGGEDGKKWISVRPAQSSSACDPEFKSALETVMSNHVYSAICLNYVAVTRAKEALTIILHPKNKTTKKPAGGKGGSDDGRLVERFSDLVRLVGLKTSGDAQWHERLVADRAKAKPSRHGEGNDIPRVMPEVRRGKRVSVSKSRPSESYCKSLRADYLFADSFGAAAERGVEAHREFAVVEWLERTEAKDAFDLAFVKPSPAATLWREKAYELFVDGKWESGQFDRVVFDGEGADRRAVIYDFKTNSMLKGEEESAFVRRMLGMYSRQLESYRNALSRLALIPVANIAIKLLLSEVRKVVDADA